MPAQRAGLTQALGAMKIIGLFPSSWPKSRVIFASAFILGFVLLVGIMIASEFGDPLTIALLKVAFGIAAITAMIAILIYSVRNLLGHYTNLGSKPWSDQVW